jgi:pentatricopeptide repeat protein
MFARMVALITGSTPTEAEPETLFEQFPEHHQTVLWNLQKALASVKNNKDRQETRNLFKLYLLARRGLLSQPKMVPKATWMALWKAFSVEGTHNPDRMARIKRLGDDMELAEFTLEPTKYIFYIEALFVEGAQASAIQKWERSVSTLGLEGTDIWRTYWELGLRMFCETEALGRALETAERLLRVARQPSEYRILLPVIKACLASRGDSSVQRAWALYIRMRSCMGSEMNMEDYDAIISMFLTVNEPDLALGVFKDMMLTGDDYALLQSDSITQYRDVTGFSGDLLPTTIEDQELNWQTPRNLARLPAKFRNKFFFGSWMKKLIGERQLNEAKQVLDLMQDRGIQPSAIQMNGLIGAWFREVTERNRVNAEDMAWRMIKARIDLVEARSISYNLQAPLRTVRSPNLEDKRSILLTTSATMETFCVLVEQYRRRQKFDKMADVLAAVHKAQLPINTYFMNQLLLIDAKTNPYGWKTYLSLRHDKGVVPDFKTYISLWKSMRRTLDPVKATFKDKLPADFPTCREVFADMVANISALTQKGEIPRDLYELVIQSFCFAQDQPGTAVALRALERDFHAFPNPETGRTIVLSLARLGLVNEAGKKPRRLDLGSSITKARIEGVTRILQLFKSQREEALLEQGIVLDQMEGDERLEETLNMLSDLLRYSAEMRFAEKVPKYNALEACIKAAEEMGVPDCAPWVPL